MRRERAVLAVAPAGPRQRERDVAGEGDPAAHPRTIVRWHAGAHARSSPRRVLLALAARRLRRPATRRPTGPNETRDAAAGLHAQRRPRGHLRGRPSAATTTREGVAARDPQAERLDRRAEAAPGRPRRPRDPRHPRPRARPRAGPRPRRRDGGRPAPLAAVLAQPGVRTPQGPRGQARRRHRAAVATRAVLRSVVAGAGGDPDRVRETTIGFEAVKALLAGRVGGGDRVLERRGRRAAREAARRSASSASTTTARRAYPELVLTRHARDARGAARRSCARRSAALQRGYTQTPERPGERGRDDARARAGPRPRGARARSSTPSPPPSRPGGQFGELRPPGCGSGRRGTRGSGS